MSGFADLHLHSVYSDGKYTPREVCARAKKNGVSLLSITDHDTLMGEEDKQSAAKEYGLSYLSGWEISAYEKGEKIHILGYRCTQGEAYEAFTRKRREAALLRAEDSVKKMNALGVPVRLDDVLAERSSPDLPVHTMHVARAIAGYTDCTDGEAYLRYLAIGRPANSAIGRPTPREAIDCIHQSGGFAVIAHPGRILMDEGERERLIRALADYGLDGIESVYTTHTQRETAYFARLARALGLCVTGGSDTHFEEETHTIGFPRFIPDEGLLSLL